MCVPVRWLMWVYATLLSFLFFLIISVSIVCASLLKFLSFLIISVFIVCASLDLLLNADRSLVDLTSIRLSASDAKQLCKYATSLSLSLCADFSHIQRGINSCVQTQAPLHTHTTPLAHTKRRMRVSNC